MTPEQDAISMFWRHKRAWAAFGIAGAAVAALGVAWFWIPDASTPAVLLSFAAALVVLVASLVLIGGSLLYYRTVHAGLAVSVTGAARDAFTKLPALSIWFILLALLASTGRWWIWIVDPAILLPFAGPVAAYGFRGLIPKSWPVRYLAGYALMLGTGVALPWLLWTWRPPLAGLPLETASVAVRLTIAYALAITSWLLLASLLGRLQAESRDRAS